MLTKTYLFYIFLFIHSTLLISCIGLSLLLLLLIFSIRHEATHAQMPNLGILRPGACVYSFYSHNA